jgi:hypothetical protein
MITIHHDDAEVRAARSGALSPASAKALAAKKNRENAESRKQGDAACQAELDALLADCRRVNEQVQREKAKAPAKASRASNDPHGWATAAAKASGRRAGGAR